MPSDSQTFALSPGKSVLKNWRIECYLVSSFLLHVESKRSPFCHTGSTDFVKAQHLAEVLYQEQIQVCS